MTESTDIHQIIADQKEQQPRSIGGTADLPVEPGEPSKIPSEWAHLRDRNKKPFNPEIHETNPDGSPVVNPSGTLKLKSGPGRPSVAGQPERKSKINVQKTRERREQPPEEKPPDQTETPSVSPAAIAMQAEMCLTLYRGAGAMVHPDFMKSEGPATGLVRQALSAYLEETGGVNLPSWAQLGIVLVAAGTWELAMLGKIKLPASITGVFGAMFGGMNGPVDMGEAKKREQYHSGNVGVGQDNVGAGDRKAA